MITCDKYVDCDGALRPEKARKSLAFTSVTFNWLSLTDVDQSRNPNYSTSRESVVYESDILLGEHIVHCSRGIPSPALI